MHRNGHRNGTVMGHRNGHRNVNVDYDVVTKLSEVVS